jgi:hypothetical protein
MNPAVDWWQSLGMKTVINGQGTSTALGGSLLPPEVVQAMADAAGSFVTIANHSPHVILEWSPWHSDLMAEEVVRRLRKGDPSIAVLAEGERALRVAV